MIAFCIGYTDAEVMTREFGKTIPATALADLERNEAVVKLLGAVPTANRSGRNCDRRWKTAFAGLQNSSRCRASDSPCRVGKLRRR
jgi:hypothetical protein